jgi:hypothetical protein
MAKVNLIPVVDICKFHEVDLNFINDLRNAELIDFEEIETSSYISEADLIKIEKAIRLHMELEINLAGIEAIYHLLDRIEAMQQEIIHLKNRRIH